jgi:ArsR family transcriptional regulator
MDLLKIYESLCERTRLRIIHLLLSGPLCVCHFQNVLQEPQVKVSKHLAHLRHHGLVEAERSSNWMVYRLPRNPSPQLRANFACLQTCAKEEKLLRADAKRLARLRTDFGTDCPICVRKTQSRCC